MSVYIYLLKNADFLGRPVENCYIKIDGKKYGVNSNYFIKERILALAGTSSFFIFTRKNYKIIVFWRSDAIYSPMIVPNKRHTFIKLVH